MTENDWLTHNLHERLTNLNTDLKVTIKSYDSEQLSFKDASDRIVQKIANLNKPIFISLSGGMDSEYVLKCFMDNKIDVTPIIVKTDGNLYESSYAFHFCRKNDITPIVLENFNNQDILKIFYNDIFKKINGVGIHSVPALISGRYAEDNNGILIRGEHLIEDDVDWNASIKGIGSNEYDFYNDTLIHKENTYYFFLHDINIAKAMVREIRVDETAQEFKHRIYGIPYRPKFDYHYDKLFDDVFNSILKSRLYRPNYSFRFDINKFKD